jgi:hypothetical protein
MFLLLIIASVFSSKTQRTRIHESIKPEVTSYKYLMNLILTAAKLARSSTVGSFDFENAQKFVDLSESLLNVGYSLTKEDLTAIEVIAELILNAVRSSNFQISLCIKKLKMKSAIKKLIRKVRGRSEGAKKHTSSEFLFTLVNEVSETLERYRSSKSKVILEKLKSQSRQLETFLKLSYDQVTLVVSRDLLEAIFVTGYSVFAKSAEFDFQATRSFLESVYTCFAPAKYFITTDLLAVQIQAQRILVKLIASKALKESSKDLRTELDTTVSILHELIIYRDPFRPIRRYDEILREP